MKGDGNVLGIECVDELLSRECWVVDLLPRRVPAESEGQFFAVERWFLDGERGQGLRRKFADILLKLNCYYDLRIFRGESGKGKKNPSPKKLTQWVLEGRDGLNVLLEYEDALITVPTDSTCMAVYNPHEDLLELIRLLADSEGLFVMRANNQADVCQGDGSLDTP